MMLNQSQATPVTAIDPETAERLAAMFAALSDPTRLQIILVLSHHELSVGEIAALVGISESATSHQLRLLRASRIVRARKAGRQVFYCLDDEHIHDLLDRGLAHVRHE